jgi:glycosyltransferase involved in cell wall biosynthesis
MKYKILIIDAFKSCGGEEEIAFSVYSGLDRNKYEVKLAAPKESPYYIKKKPNKSEWIICKTCGAADFYSMVQLRKLVKKNHIDLINVHGYSSGFFVRVACAGIKNTRIIWTMHSNIADNILISKAKKRIRVKVENILSNHRFFNDRIICVSNDGKIGLLNRHINHVPIDVIYNGVDLSQFNKACNPLKHSGNLRLGMVSRLAYGKDYTTLIEAVRILVSENLNINLLIAGDGELKEPIEQQIRAADLNGRVQLVGFQKDVTRTLENVDVFVLSTLFESFPVTVIEAMSSGIPVIATNVNGISEIVIPDVNGYLVNLRDTDDLCDKIRKYYFNRSKIIQHGAAGREMVEKCYSKSMMVSQYENLFDKVIHNK